MRSPTATGRSSCSPSSEPEDELCFLLGADMAAGLASWKEPARVLELASLGVVPRPGVGLGAVESALERLGASDRAEIIDMPLCGASSTTVRQRAREGKPLRHLVPDPVVQGDRGEGAVPMTRGGRR